MTSSSTNPSTSTLPYSISPRVLPVYIRVSHSQWECPKRGDKWVVDNDIFWNLIFRLYRTTYAYVPNAASNFLYLHLGLSILKFKFSTYFHQISCFYFFIHVCYWMSVEEVFVCLCIIRLYVESQNHSITRHRKVYDKDIVRRSRQRRWRRI